MRGWNTPDDSWPRCERDDGTSERADRDVLSERLDLRESERASASSVTGTSSVILCKVTATTDSGDKANSRLSFVLPFQRLYGLVESLVQLIRLVELIAYQVTSA